MKYVNHVYASPLLIESDVAEDAAPAEEGDVAEDVAPAEGHIIT